VETVSRTLPQLNKLSLQESRDLAIRLVDEQLVKARERLHYWRAITNQPAQIDTGYVAQHLVSIVTGIRGGGMRGKGDDLVDGSEVKSANFLDAFDARGAVAPRWNFTIKQESDLRIYLDAPRVFLASIDLAPQQAKKLLEIDARCLDQILAETNTPPSLHRHFARTFRGPQFFFTAKAAQRLERLLNRWSTLVVGLNAREKAGQMFGAAEAMLRQSAEERLSVTNCCRIRVWELTPAQHDVFSKRFEEWVIAKAIPKFQRLSQGGKRQDANFQLFPPHFGTDETYARHGSGRANELAPLRIELESTVGSRRIMKIERDQEGRYAGE
jgi:hypothetical protein